MKEADEQIFPGFDTCELQKTTEDEDLWAGV